MNAGDFFNDILEFFRYLDWPKVMVQFLALFITVIGIVCIIGGHLELHYAGRSMNWPSVTGIISRSEIEKFFSDRDTSYPSYHALIEYSYSVKGKDYSSNRRSFQSRALDLKEAKSLVKKYRLDFPVAVYYDPDKPSESVLERGVYWENYAMAITGWFLLTGGLVFFIYVIVRVRLE